MNNVFSITDSCEKIRIAREILEALPEWFGIPEARENGSDGFPLPRALPDSRRHHQ